MSRCPMGVLRRSKETTMDRSETLPPPRQDVFEFLRTDIWSQLSVAAQESCLRLLVQQLKQSLEHDQKEVDDERKDSR